MECHQVSTLLSEKVKLIREAENFNQKEFAEKCGLVYGTYRNYESEVRQPNIESIQKICTAFPHYMWYLMQESMDGAPDGQITPEEKKLRDLSTLEETA